MQLGIIGAGRMGANLTRRLLRAGHHCVVYDADHVAASALEPDGAVAATSPADMAAQLAHPRAVWVMVPAAATSTVIDELAAAMTVDDIIIDGGNSHYTDSIDRSNALASQGIHYVDVGTSGGVHGLERGYCLMIGGATPVVQHLDQVFADLAPGVDAATRTCVTDGVPTSAEHGYLHCGPAGAGHFVKMIHNGIEYGQMAALAEGLAILRNADVGKAERDADAETAPPPEAARYQYEFDIPQITEVWRRGSVIASWLLDLTAVALQENPSLSGYSGRVSDSGEGRWAVQAALDEGVPAYVLTTALFERFSSRSEGEYADKVLSAMREAFGGHHEKVACT